MFSFNFFLGVVNNCDFIPFIEYMLNWSLVIGIKSFILLFLFDIIQLFPFFLYHFILQCVIISQQNYFSFIIIGSSLLFDNTYNLFPHTVCMMVLWFMYLYYMFKGLIEKIGSVLMTKLMNRALLSYYFVLKQSYNLIYDSNCNQLLFLEFSSNLSLKIPTIVLVFCKCHSYECNVFAQLIGYVYSLFWSGGLNTWVAR